MKDRSDNVHAVVIGGGAAGYFGAIRCAELYPNARVTLLEATRRPLAKVRVSGGGRCNVTHNCFDPAALVGNYPRGSRELRGPYSRFQPKDTIAWFESRGVALKAEGDGRMFPTTDSSETIIACLESSARAAGVDIRLGTLVQKIERVAPIDDAVTGAFRIHLRGGDAVLCDTLLLATGSALFGYDLARQLGHTVEPLVPSLFTFVIEDPRLSGLAGISFPLAELRVTVPGGTSLAQRGPLLVTHWGLSGPAVLKLSAWGAAVLAATAYEADLSINFLPSLTHETALAALRAYKEEHPRRTVAAHQPLPVPKRFWTQLVAHLQVASDATWAEQSKQTLATLAQELTGGRYGIRGKGVFKEEFVTAGGVRLKEVDFRTMQSRLVPGLYFAGELLDVDGVTGGFNFQAAWTTSFIAGEGLGAR